MVHGAVEKEQLYIMSIMTTKVFCDKVRYRKRSSSITATVKLQGRDRKARRKTEVLRNEKQRGWERCRSGKGNKMFANLMSSLCQECIKNDVPDSTERSIYFAYSDKKKPGSNVVGKEACLSE